MKKHTPSLSIFFPFLNDWGTVGTLIALAIQTARTITPDWEVLIVNDGSSKENRQALVDIVATITRTEDYKKRIRIIHHPKNLGYGAALRTGFANASKTLIFYTDCDAQYDPRELSLLYKALKPNTGMVNGYKIKRQDPWYRTVAGRMYHHIVKRAFNHPISDTDCDFRLIRRNIFQKVKLFENTGTICVELVKKIDYAGFPIIEVPVHHYWRTSGKSQFFNIQRLSKTALNLITLWHKLIVVKNYYS